MCTLIYQQKHLFHSLHYTMVHVSTDSCTDNPNVIKMLDIALCPNSSETRIRISFVY